MKPLPRLLVALGLAAIAAGAAAQPVAGPHVRNELVAESRGVAPGGAVHLAVVQVLDPGWHTYWRNPGDAGEAATLSWTLPPGWRAGPIAWPTPRRLPVGPIMNYGYEGTVLLPVSLQAPETEPLGGPAQIAVKIDYLVCAEVCIPGSASLRLSLPVVAGTPARDPHWGPAIARALAGAPTAAGLTARYERVGAGAGSRLALAVAGDALAGNKGREAYFYPYDEKLIDHAKPQAVERGPSGLTLGLTPAPNPAPTAPPSTAAPHLVEGVLVVDGRSFAIAAGLGPPPAGASGLGPPAATHTRAALGLAGALGFALIGGVILNLMPCVFPILSMKAAAFAGHGGQGRAARVQGVAFLLGVLAAFLLLAGALIAARAGGAAVGWGFQLQSPLVVGLLCLVILASALNLSGVYELGTSAQGLGATLAGRAGAAGAFFTGALAVVVAAPCTAPFMGAALGWALTQPPLLALAVFAALGLGFAAPFTALSFSPALIARLPRPGPWMEGLRHALAFPMYAAAAWLAWVLASQAGLDGLARLLAAALALALAAWLWGVAQRGAARGGRGAPAVRAAAAAFALVAIGAAASGGAGAVAAPAARRSAALASEPFSPARLAALRAEGRPVLVNFTAAWCVTCQVNERAALASPAVAAALRRVGGAYLVADWTRRDGVIAAALAEQGRIGVPLYLVYGQGDGPPTVLPQILTPGVIVRALDSTAGQGAGAG